MDGAVAPLLREKTEGPHTEELKPGGPEPEEAKA